MGRYSLAFLAMILTMADSVSVVAKLQWLDEPNLPKPIQLVLAQMAQLSSAAKADAMLVAFEVKFVGLRLP